jgi:hypothetical protein
MTAMYQPCFIYNAYFPTPRRRHSHPSAAISEHSLPLTAADTPVTSTRAPSVPSRLQQSSELGS